MGKENVEVVLGDIYVGKLLSKIVKEEEPTQVKKFHVN